MCVKVGGAGASLSKAVTNTIFSCLYVSSKLPAQLSQYQIKTMLRGNTSTWAKLFSLIVLSGNYYITLSYVNLQLLKSNSNQHDYIFYVPNLIKNYFRLSPSKSKNLLQIRDIQYRRKFLKRGPENFDQRNIIKIRSEFCFCLMFEEPEEHHHPNPNSELRWQGNHAA